MAKKHTKKALFTSVMSLVLCFAMLVGTTFAWFTDSVSTANNLIQSGNLDVELYWSKDCSSWEKVDATTNVFDKEALWEPGYTEIVYLKTVNEGTLYLKYQLGANVVSEVASTNLAGDPFKLSDYIHYGVAETTTKFVDRTAAQNAMSSDTSLASPYSSKIITLAPKAEEIAALVVYMPESVGNEANYKTGATVPQIVLGLNVMATQVESELDSFGKDYDMNATLPEGALSAPTKAFSNVRADGSVTLNVAAAPSEITKLTTVEAPAGTYPEGRPVEMSVSTANTLFNVSKDGFTVASLDVSLKVDDIEQTDAIDGLYTVTTYISKGLDNADVIVKYTGSDGKAQPTKVSYDSNTGKLVFTTNHFSQYEVSAKGWAYDKNDKAYTTIQDVIDNIDNAIIPDAHKEAIFNATDNKYVQEAVSSAKINGVSYLTAKEAFAASQEGDTITLKAGSYQFSGNTIKKGVTIEGAEGVVFTDTLKGTLDGVTIKNVHIKSGNAQRWAYSKGTLVFDGCTFEATGVYAIHYDGLNGANITYKNCEIIGWAAIGEGAEHITFENCTIKGNGSYGLIRLYSPGTIKNCTFDVANVNTSDVYQDGIHAVDCKIEVENCTNVNGDITDLFNTSGTGTIINNGVAYVEKADGLDGALAEGGTVILTEDAAAAGQIHVGKGGTLDGNGKTLTVSSGAAAYESGLTVTQGTAKNITVVGAYRGLGVGGSGASEMTGDVTYENVTVTGATYGVNIGVGNGHKLTMTKCTFGDWNSYSGLSSAEFNGCTFTSEGKYYASQRISANATFTYNNCEFKQNTYNNNNGSDNYYLDSYGNGVIALNNCTIEGVKITAANVKEYFQITEKVTVVVNGTTVADNVAVLASTMKEGNDVVLTEDVTAPLSSTAIYGTPVAVIQKGGTFDGNGNSLIIENPQYNGYAIETYAGTIKNLTIDTEVGRGIVISSPTTDIYIDNVVVDGPGYALNTTEHNGKNLYVTNSTLNGWTSFAGLDSASFANCKFGENTAKYWQNMGYEQDYDRLIRPYVNTVFTDCVFELNFYIDLSALETDCTITLDGCTANGTVITANNYNDLLTIELPSGRTLADCVIFK